MSDDDSGRRGPRRRAGRVRDGSVLARPAARRMLEMVVTLGAEVWALRERVAVLETLQARRGARAARELLDFEFTPAQLRRLAAERKEFIASLYGALQGPASRRAPRRRRR